MFEKRQKNLIILYSRWNKLFLIIACFFLIGAIFSSGSSKVPVESDLHGNNAILLKNIQFDTTAEQPDAGVSGMSISQYQADMEGYYIVQFMGYIRDEWKQSVRDTGAVIFDYVPNNAFVVRMNASVKAKVEALDVVQWTGIYQPAYRISPVLQTGRAAGENITVLLFDAEDRKRISEEITGLGGAVLESAGDRIRVHADRSKIPDIAVINGVSWIEKYVHPVVFNDVAANITGVYTVRNTHGLNGSGQIVAVADTGLDTGIDDATMHDDMEGRIVQIYDIVGDGAADLYSGHGTHVAGSVLGNGSRSGGQFKGMAPGATLVFEAMGDSTDGLYLPVPFTSLFQMAYSSGAKIHSNSWGFFGVPGDYLTYSRDVDDFVWSNPDMLIVFAGGNDGVDANSDGIVDQGSISPPATAKNVLAVGASENYRPLIAGTYGGAWPLDFPANPISADKMTDDVSGLAAFSSRGATDDGRIKPDVVAPGTYVISARSSVATSVLWGDYDAYYRYSGGTSMSTPVVAGMAALVRQYYVQNESIAPSAALLKATIINGADNMTPGQYGTGATQEIQRRPDSAQGWGRINLSNSLFPVAPRTMHYHDNTTGLSTSQSWNTRYYVNDSSESLRVTLVWTDYKGNPAAVNQLVNNLTLNVTTPSDSRYFGNGGDGVNNVEEVELFSPQVGWYDIRVEGTNIPQGPQPFAIVMSGALVSYNIDSCITISMPGTYTLVRNITNSTASGCIEITSRDVVFDGAGYTIDGVDNPGSEGIDVYKQSAYLTNVTVKNLTSTDWGTGIIYIDVSNGSIDNSADYSNILYGIHLKYSNNISLTGNIAKNNAEYGIFLGGSDNNTLTNNMANTNENNGIYLSSSDGNTLRDNNANNNTNGNGIKLSSSGNNTLENNTANNNSVYGIYIDSSSNYNKITNNTANSNAQFGINIVSSSGNTISSNTANLNYDGIILNSYAGNSIVSNNTANSNTINGIYLFSSGSNNTLTNNTANLNGNAGINLFGSSGNTISNNNASSNNYYGFYLYSSVNNTLSNNIANLNDQGISISYSGNNTLSGNNMTGNTYNFYLGGSQESDFNNSIYTNNSVDGKPVLYVKYASDTEYNSSISAGVFYCISCSNVTIKDFYLTKNGYGVFFWNTSISRIENITANMNINGLVLVNSSDNTLAYNTASSNGIGIVLGFSANNTINNNNANLNSEGFSFSYSSNNSLIDNTATGNSLWDYHSISGSTNNTVINLTINPAISFTGKDIAIKSVSSPPSDSPGYKNLSRYINATNTSADSWLFLNMSYYESEVTNLDESSLRIWRYSGSAWSQVSNSGVDTAQNRIFANITSFSIFAPLALPDTIPPAVTNLVVTPYTPETGESVNITVNANDIHMNYTSVYVTVEHPGSYTNTSQMNGNLSYYYVYANTSEYGRYNVTINASDVSGNFNNTEKTWFITITAFNSEFIRIHSGGNGTIASGSTTWNKENFPGLAHEETVTVMNVSGRTILPGSVWYNTSRKLVQYKMNKYKSIDVENAFDGNGVKISDGGGWHYRIGWQGISNVAVNGTANKTGTVIEHEWSKKTMVTGESWRLGDGYILTPQAIDANVTPALVWFSFKKNGIAVDDMVVNGTYNYSAPGFAGESSIPIVAAYVEGIFKGTTRDMVKLGYSWFIYNVTNITPGSSFGNLTVDRTSDDALNLTNVNSINLTQNSAVHLMGDLYFNVTNSSTLEYFPYFPVPAHVDAAASANTTLDIVALTGVQGFINITMMEDIPPDMNRSFGFIPFGKYVSIFPNMADDFRWVMLRIYYTEDELTRSGLSESSLQIYRYNDTVYPDKWEALAAGSPSWVYETGLSTTNTGIYSGYVWANVSRLGYYAMGVPIPASPTSPPCTTCSGSGSGSGSSGGGGGGGGTSGENYSNIEAKEKRDLYVFKDKVSSYRFNTTDPIMYVNITGNISAGEVTTMVEVLRNISSLVKNTSAPGIVYKNVNIWVGTSGFAIPKNIQKGVIGFRVRNSWLEDKELAAGDIRLVKWDGSRWIELDTTEITKGSEHVYYEALTDSFSPFAITALKSAVPPVEATKTPVAEHQTPAPEERGGSKEGASGHIGVLLVTALVLFMIVAILAAAYLREKKKI